MKKLLVVLLILAVASMAFIGCQGRGNQNRDITVGFAQAKADESDWRMANTRSMLDAFNRAGWRLILADSNNDAAKQIADVQNFINMGVDYIVISAVNEAGWDTVLRNAQRANIPVILNDRTMQASEDLWLAWFGGSFRHEGDLAMDWIEKRFGANPVGLVHLQGQLGASAQVGRTEAVDAALARNSNWNLLARQTGDWGTDRARAVMTVWIQQHRNRINVVFAENDNMALGAIQALQEAGIRVGGANGVAIVTVDANRWSLQMTLEGLINYNVECNPLLGPGIFTIIDNHRKGIMPPKRSTVDALTFAYDSITQAVINARAY